jgi:lactoylglutathione lyase
MDRGIKFYRDVVGLPIKFQSPGWSDFAYWRNYSWLHPASEKNPAGKLEIGFNVPDLQQFHAEFTSKGVQFPMTRQHFHAVLSGCRIGRYSL